MLLVNIYNAAAYITDEELTTTQAVNLANEGIAKINTMVNTNLPFFTTDNYQKDEYDAVTKNWQFALLEPFLSWTIAANDAAAENIIEFHYQRFLSAIADFKNRGLGDIKTEDDEGNPTGYEGTSKRIVPIDSTNVVNPFGSWW